jgi:hypothetical protein
MRQAHAYQPGDEVWHWRLLYRAGIKHGHRLWLCQCRCLTIKEVYSHMLKIGRSRSCGCASQDRKRRPLIHEYRAENSIWYAIQSRCLNPSNKRFQDYGGRGITICARWLTSFEAFVTDVGRRPTPEHTIDRIDNNGSYTCGHCAECVAHHWPMNVRWATRKEQNRNRRDSHFLTWNGQTYTAAEWGERQAHVTPRAICFRKASGWTDEESLMRPLEVAHGRSRRGGRGRAGFIGVHVNGQHWIARIEHKGERYYLGSYTNTIAAARAYDAKARELLGDQAIVNFPEVPHV